MSHEPPLAASPDYLSTITPKAIEEYKAQRLQQVKPATVNRELALLKGMFSKAMEWGFVKESSQGRQITQRAPWAGPIFDA
jgi:hypothetical protein